MYIKTHPNNIKLKVIFLDFITKKWKTSALPIVHLLSYLAHSYISSQLSFPEVGPDKVGEYRGLIIMNSLVIITHLIKQIISSI